jgi:hypothetical protein
MKYICTIFDVVVNFFSMTIRYTHFVKSKTICRIIDPGLRNLYKETYVTRYLEKRYMYMTPQHPNSLYRHAVIIIFPFVL